MIYFTNPLFTTCFALPSLSLQMIFNSYKHMSVFSDGRLPIYEIIYFQSTPCERKTFE